MKNRMDRTTKILLALLVVGVWGLLLRPLLVATPAQARQQPPPANRRPAPLVIERPVVVERSGRRAAESEQEIVGPLSHAPSMVVMNGSIYVAGDGYISRVTTNGGQSLDVVESEKLPSRTIVKVPPGGANGAGGGFGGGGGGGFARP